MKRTNIDISQLLPLYFEGKLNEKETLVVENWMKESDENKKIAEDMAMIYFSMDKLYALSNVDEKSAWRSVKSEANNLDKHRWLPMIERVAAILFLPLLLVSVLQFFKYDKANHTTMLSYATSPGMTASLSLPDGTTVKMNSESRLTYPSDFTGDIREVSLQGEAYFEVAKDKTHPFVVKTPQHAAVKVYGTHFNVDAYSVDSIATATLVEGRISMIYQGKDGKWEETLIKPGEAIEYSPYDRAVKVNTVATDVVTSWKDGKLVFRETPFKEVLKCLSRRYGVDFVVKNPNIYKNSFTGTIQRQRLERVLEYFTVASKIRFRYLTSGNLSNEKQVIKVY